MNITKRDLTKTIKREARRLGFDLIGVTTPEPPAHMDVYRNWLKAGNHGEMGYLSNARAIARRANPLKILPNCQSILVAGMNYYTGINVSQDPHPRISIYALGQDYHEVITERLQSLVSFISDLVGDTIAHRIYVDTGPLLERELAQRAGLGWIGKNSNLINPKLGSYVFLAELLLDLDLTPDLPFISDRCGACTKCIDACPTGCILPNRTLDARKCISYLTIEHKGSIPQELRPMIGEWIFGCDICQQVCPWNTRFAKPHHEPSFNPIPILSRAHLETFLTLSQESFSNNFRDSPLKRAKWRGILRNAAILAGNFHDRKLIPELTALSSHPEAIVRSQVAWALGCIGGEEVLKLLIEHSECEEDVLVSEEILMAIKKITSK